MIAWFSFCFLMRGCMGNEYIPPATPRKSGLITVTFGDLLEDSPHPDPLPRVRGRGEREEGRRGYRDERAGARRGSLALRCPANTAATRRSGPLGASFGEGAEISYTIRNATSNAEGAADADNADFAVAELQDERHRAAQPLLGIVSERNKTVDQQTNGSFIHLQG